MASCSRLGCRWVSRGAAPPAQDRVPSRGRQGEKAPDHRAPSITEDAKGQQHGCSDLRFGIKPLDLSGGAKTFTEMYPLPETILPLHELVEHWLKFQPERVTYNEVATRLLACFWEGELFLRDYLNDKIIERSTVLSILQFIADGNGDGVNCHIP